MVVVFSFYSDNPRLNPAEDYNVFLKLFLKRTKIDKKRSGLDHLKKFHLNNLVW